MSSRHKKRKEGGILKVSPYDYFSFFMSVEMKELEPAHDILLLSYFLGSLSFRAVGRSALVGHPCCTAVWTV